MTRRARRRRRSSSEAGAELVEFALILPVLVLILMGLVDFGFLFQAQEVVVNASREGARLAIVGSGYTTANIQNRVATYVATGIPYSTITPTTTVTTGTLAIGGGSVVGTKVVTVGYPYVFQYLGPIAALLGSSFTTINLTGATTMRTSAAAGS